MLQNTKHQLKIDVGGPLGTPWFLESNANLFTPMQIQQEDIIFYSVWWMEGWMDDIAVLQVLQR